MADEPKLSNTTADMTVTIVVFLIILGLFGAYVGDAIGIYTRILEWFYSRNWTAALSVLKIVLTVVDVILIAFVIFTLRQYSKLDKMPPPASTSPTAIHVTPPREEVQENWEHIRGLANSKNPSDWNMAILRADALLDDILMHLGYEGPTIADRLKIVDSHKLPSWERIWSAHRLRNMIAHDPLQQHTRESIIHALRSYEQAFKELGMLGASFPVEEKILQ